MPTQFIQRGEALAFVAGGGLSKAGGFCSDEGSPQSHAARAERPNSRFYNAFQNSSRASRPSENSVPIPLPAHKGSPTKTIVVSVAPARHSSSYTKPNSLEEVMPEQVAASQMNFSLLSRQKSPQEEPKTSANPCQGAHWGDNEFHSSGVHQSRKEDWIRAFKEHLRNALKGSAKSCYLIGECYHTGRGVGKDDQIALGLYRKAGKRGQPDALAALSRLYETGEFEDIGLPRNPRKAKKYQKLARDAKQREEKSVADMTVPNETVRRNSARAVWGSYQTTPTESTGCSPLSQACQVKQRQRSQSSKVGMARKVVSKQMKAATSKAKSLLQGLRKGRNSAPSSPAKDRHFLHARASSFHGEIKL